MGEVTGDTLLCIQQWFLTRGDFTHQVTFDNVWRYIFDVTTEERKVVLTGVYYTGAGVLLNTLQ